MRNSWEQVSVSVSISPTTWPEIVILSMWVSEAWAHPHFDLILHWVLLTNMPLFWSPLAFHLLFSLLHWFCPHIVTCQVVSCPSGPSSNLISLVSLFSPDSFQIVTFPKASLYCILLYFLHSPTTNWKYLAYLLSYWLSPFLEYKFLLGQNFIYLIHPWISNTQKIVWHIVSPR